MVFLLLEVALLLLLKGKLIFMFIRIIFNSFSESRKILVYPKGNLNGKAKAISVYLCSCNCLLSDLKYFAKFKLRIRDQINKNHVENTGKSNILTIFSFQMLGKYRLQWRFCFSICLISYQSYG